MRKRVKWAAFGVAFGWSASVGAYEIGNKTGVQTWDLHETMTALAIECSRSGTVKPGNCVTGWDPVDHPLRNRAVQSQDDKNGALEDSARWADDPSRQLNSTASSAHWGVAMWRSCKEIMTGENHIDNVGLACSAHYGRLQFWHAMRSTPDETADETRGKILAWAAFAYRAATEPDFRAADYCQTVAALDAGNPLRVPLSFSNDNFCRERRGWLGARYPAWRVATLFGFRCRYAATTRSGCRDLSVGNDELARVAAIGGLLHLVQDSYSQAHVVRRNPGEAIPAGSGPFEPRIVCRPAEHFHDYAEQKRAGPDVHSSADQPPKIDASCFAADRSVDDAVTASANILWFTSARDTERTPESFVQYLATRVFPAR